MTLKILNQSLTQMRGQVEQLEADLQNIEHHAKIFSEDHLCNTTAEVIQVAEQGKAAFRRLESQVQERLSQMGGQPEMYGLMLSYPLDVF